MSNIFKNNLKTHLKNPSRNNKPELYCFADNLAVCDALLRSGVRIIQLRNKHADDSTFLQLARDMATLTKQFDAILIVNDRVEIAIEIDADGIHVGQEDQNYREVIKKVPQKMIVGVSVDTANEAVEAQRFGATYVGAGSVFPTSTKLDAVVIGIKGLDSIVKAVSIPVVAIGGISLQNIRDVLKTGANPIAVVSAINSSENIAQAVADFFAILDNN